MKHTRFIKLFCVLATLFCAPISHAQSVSSSGVSGVIAPLRGGQNVRLVEHEARVVLPSRRVVSRSVLRNEGGATTVVIALPETGQPSESGPLPRAGFLRNLQMSVDGKRVKLRRVVRENGAIVADISENYEFEYSTFWATDVKFARGQTHVVQTSFTSDDYHLNGPPETGTRRFFEYDLLTARGWKDRVGDLRILVDASAIKPEQDVTWAIDQPQKSGKIAVWHWRNFKPMNTFVVSWAAGFQNIFVNGEKQSDVCVVVGSSNESGEYASVYAERRSNSWWVPLRLLASWLPTEKDAPQLGQGAYRGMRGLSWRGRSVDVEIGNRVLEGTIGGKRTLIYMSQPAFDVRGTTMVELAPAMRLLGGSARYDDKKNRLDISIK